MAEDSTPGDSKAAAELDVMAQASNERISSAVAATSGSTAPPAAIAEDIDGSQRTPQGEELAALCRETSVRVSEPGLSVSLLNHGALALATFDSLRPLLEADGGSISELLEDTRNELIDSYLSMIAGRPKAARVMLRGVMEGIFTAIYYRRQEISLHLWASGRSFEMVHSMFAGEHPFKLYFSALFEDERFKLQYPGVGAKQPIKEASEVYDELSSFVHKKSASTRSGLVTSFENLVARLFRIALTFLEREYDLPAIEFPQPLTYCATIQKELANERQYLA